MPDSATPRAPSPLAASNDAGGLAAAAAAFFIWGLLPLYLKALQSVPVVQVAAHRLLWGCLAALSWLALRGELGQIVTALREPHVRWRLCASALLIAVNWLTYVYGIVTHRAIEASLGYFLNPLFNVLLGVLILSERLNPAQWTAVSLAAGAVVYLAWCSSHLPWISLTLALSFSLYGFVRKVVRVDALAGFAGETLLLLPLATAYLAWCAAEGTGSLNSFGPGISLLLVLCGPLSAVPLVLFAYGARRVAYSTIGVMQYLSPTLGLMVAVWAFREPFEGPRVVAFVVIWIALLIYVADGLWRSRMRLRSPRD